MKARRWLQAVLGSVLLCTVIGGLHGAMIPIEDAEDPLPPETNRFDIIAAPSDLYLTPAELATIESLAGIGFGVSTSSQLQASLELAGSVFNDLEPGAYDINAFGAAAPEIGVAFQGIEVAAVPIPPAAVLFAGSLVALVTVGRRRRQLPHRQ